MFLEKKFKKKNFSSKFQKIKIASDFLLVETPSGAYPLDFQRLRNNNKRTIYNVSR